MTNDIAVFWWCVEGHLVDEPVEHCREHPGKATLTGCPACLLPIVPLPDGGRPEGCSCGHALPWHSETVSPSEEPNQALT
jgi:hypothetical protein